MYEPMDAIYSPNLSRRSPAYGPGGQTEAWLMVKLASDKKQGDLSLLLKSGADPNIVVTVDWREFDTSPLLEAAVSGHTRIARLLIGAGAIVDAKVGPGYTALYNAAFNGHPEMCRLLLASGADFNTSTADHFTPLYIACQEGHHDCVRVLLAAGAFPDHARPGEGATALYIASQNGHSRCVEELLESDVSIDLPMHDGSTPLMIACYMQHVRVVELLLRAGASLATLDNRNRSALDWAKKRGDQLVVALVQEEMAARGTAELHSGHGLWSLFTNPKPAAHAAQRGWAEALLLAMVPCLAAGGGGCCGAGGAANKGSGGSGKGQKKGQKGGSSSSSGGGGENACCKCFQCCAPPASA